MSETLRNVYVICSVNAGMSGKKSEITQECVAKTILSFVREDGTKPAKSDILSEVSGNILHDKDAKREFLRRADSLEGVIVGKNRIYVDRPQRLRRKYKHSQYDFTVKRQ